jgi:hypothetical protein
MPGNEGDRVGGKELDDKRSLLAFRREDIPILTTGVPFSFWLRSDDGPGSGRCPFPSTSCCCRL